MKIPSARSAFTLMEILIALAIVAILAGTTGVAYLSNVQKGKVVAAKSQIETFKTALQLYADDNGAPPSARQGLEALVSPSTIAPVPAHFPEGGYLDKIEVPLDPWGRPYAYLVPGPSGKPFDVVSYGADGEEGGEGRDADLSCWR